MESGSFKLLTPGAGTGYIGGSVQLTGHQASSWKNHHHHDRRETIKTLSGITVSLALEQDASISDGKLRYSSMAANYRRQSQVQETSFPVGSRWAGGNRRENGFSFSAIPLESVAICKPASLDDPPRQGLHCSSYCPSVTGSLWLPATSGVLPTPLAKQLASLSIERRHPVW
jgi:hypothetical protein